MICVVCQKAETEEGMVCPSDRNRIRHTLDDVYELYAELPDALTRGGTAGPKVSGSKEMPLPLNVDVLDLMGPANAEPVSDQWRDQTGQIAVAAILDTWVSDWIDTRGLGERQPIATVANLNGWLLVRLDWACDKHPAIDVFATEIGKLRGAMRATLGQTDERPEHMAAPCPGCDMLTLVRKPGADRIECANQDCRRVLRDSEYGQWARMVIASERKAA